MRFILTLFIIILILYFNKLHAGETLDTIHIHSDDATSTDISTDTSITAKKEKKTEQQYRTHQSTTIENPVHDEHLGQTISRLPGVQARNQSGPGSLTTVTSPQALNSAATEISVDNIPVVDPAGIGINVSLFPRALVSAVEYQSAFYQNVDPTAVPVLTPGGRINLRTQGYSFDEPQKQLGGNLTGGSALTGEMSAAYRRKKPDAAAKHRGYDYAIGVTGHSTRGDFPYVDPRTGSRGVRENNDSNSIGAAEKFRTRTSETGVFDFVLMVSRINRTNPGSLSFPGRDHEQDTFKLMGFSFTDPALFSANSGLFAKTSGTLLRVQNNISTQVKTDAHTAGGYGQFGINSPLLGKNTITYVDHIYEKLNDGSGIHDRNTSAINAINSYDLGLILLTPGFRMQNSTHYNLIPSGSLTLSREWTNDFSTQVAHGYFAQAPAIIAKSGYYAGSLVVLPNNELLVERSGVTNISNLLITDRLEVSSTLFHQLIRNRAAYTSVGFNASQSVAQYRNVPLASVLGHTLGCKINIQNDTSLSVAGTVQRAWDNEGGHDFPYKPRTQALVQVRRAFFRNVSLSAEEEWMGKRFTNLTDESSVSPHAQTNLRADFRARDFLGGMSIFLKVSNLFDAAGFVTDGFPKPGRLFYLGIEI